MQKTTMLLINEYPLMFQPTLAVLTSLNEAIALQQLKYWLTQNANKPDHIKDGRVWCWNTYEEWQKNNFPFWSISTIKRAFTDLENRGLVIKGNFNKASFDRTGWYTIDEDAVEKLLSSGQVELIEQVNLTPASGQDDNTIPETTTETINYSASPKTLSGDKEPPSIQIDVNDQCPNFLALKKADKQRTLFDCPFCGTEQVIGVYADQCPVAGCGARIIWQNNPLYAKRAKAQATDAKAKERNRQKSDDPAVAYLETAADAKVKPEEVREIQNFVTRNGLPRFMALVDDTKTKAKDSGQWGRSIVVTVVNRLPFWGNGSPAEKKPTSEPVEQAVNLPKGTVMAIRPEALAKLKELGIE